MAKAKKRRDEVFLNIPYDNKFEKLFVAYIAGISAFGLVPRATLEIPDSSRRLEKILRLAGNCRYSVHDLSRVQLDPKKPRVPRFNMPFELGLCVAFDSLNRAHKPNWFVFEAKANRIDKSLSDLKGTDPRIHGRTVRGTLSELCNIFRRPGRQPSVPQMMEIYRSLRRKQPAILKEAGTQDPFTKRVFADICVAASAEAGRVVAD